MKASPNGTVESVKLGQEAWLALSQCLSPRETDLNFWWQLTGRQLAAFTEAAGYTKEKRYEILLTHYHWIVPYLGSSRRSNIEESNGSFPSLNNGSAPIDYRWEWNTSSIRTTRVGWTFEPRGRFADTELDPFNHDALRQLLHGLAVALPSKESSWSRQVLDTLLESQGRVPPQQGRATDGLLSTRRNTLITTEVTPQGPRFETHFKPFSLSLDQWEDIFCKVDPVNHSRVLLRDFLSRTVQGKLLKPISLRVLNAKGEDDARLKWYFWSPHTNRRYIRDIMSLGGASGSPNLDARLAEMYDLIGAITTGSTDTGDYVPGAHWYSFDISPGKTVPEVEIYIQLPTNGRDDADMARGLVSWMEAYSRGVDTGRRFLRLVNECQGSPVNKETRSNMQTFLACRLEDDEIHVTSFLELDVFQDGPTRSVTGNGQPGMMRRSTLRRDE